ncbi:restriction endonuclease subunit S [Chitinibacter sp. GC72]|uniref:restriction endonuclease subunit S n=1 Tax=Chitinibacter sp. GC72 TaxID=1526917 RepID=UPI0018E008BF|nr:restriction endonuclease subunit S [Chitinibacter sp. GC72]
MSSELQMCKILPQQEDDISSRADLLPTNKLDEWFFSTIGSQATLQRGFDITKAEQRSGAVPVVSSSGISSFHDSAKVKGPGVVLGRKGVVGSVHFLEVDFWPHDTTLWVKDFHGNNPKFVYYFFLGNSHELKGLDVGSANPTLNRNHVHPIKTIWPSLAEQNNIAEFLGTLDDRIALLHETNATLEGVAQALFKSWFVDFDPVHANAGTQAATLPPELQTLFPATFTETPQGSVPEGWGWVTLDEISEVGIGKTPPRKEQHWFSESPSDTRWVSIRDMGMCGAYIATTSEFLTQEAVERFNVRVVPTNTVMLSFKMTIGRVAISDGAMTTNEAIAHFKLSEKSQISSEFIYLHLKSFDYSTLSSTSSIADAVNSKTVKNIPILLADASVLAEFQNRIEPIFGKIKVIEQQAQTLATLRDTLLPRLISGQLRLPDAEAALAEVV